MKYVLDCSVALKWVLQEADSGRAVRLRNEYLAGIHELIAPELFTSEVANGLASAERQGRIQAGDAIAFLRDILRTAPLLFPNAPLLTRSIELALAHRRAVYDCVYLALAESEGCEYVTADDQFLRGLRSAFPCIVPLVALP